MAESSRTRPIGNLAGHRQAAVALEFLDRGFGLRIVNAGRLELPVTEIGKRALDREHLLGRRDQFGDRIVARRRRRGAAALRRWRWT